MNFDECPQFLSSPQSYDLVEKPPIKCKKRKTRKTVHKYLNTNILLENDPSKLTMRQRILQQKYQNKKSTMENIDILSTGLEIPIKKEQYKIKLPVNSKIRLECDKENHNDLNDENEDFKNDEKSNFEVKDDKSNDENEQAVIEEPSVSNTVNEFVIEVELNDEKSNFGVKNDEHCLAIIEEPLVRNTEDEVSNVEEIIVYNDENVEEIIVKDDEEIEVRNVKDLVKEDEIIEQNDEIEDEKFEEKEVICEDKEIFVNDKEIFVNDKEIFVNDKEIFVNEERLIDPLLTQICLFTSTDLVLYKLFHSPLPDLTPKLLLEDCDILTCNEKLNLGQENLSSCDDLSDDFSKMEIFGSDITNKPMKKRRILFGESSKKKKEACIYKAAFYITKLEHAAKNEEIRKKCIYYTDILVKAFKESGCVCKVVGEVKWFLNSK